MESLRGTGRFMIVAHGRALLKEMKEDKDSERNPLYMYKGSMPSG